eukprot:6996779-Alexandrium_andersonii.AAC.1
MCKVEGCLGSGTGDLREVMLLSRVIRWTPEGHLYEAGPRHVEQLICDLLGPRPGVKAVSLRATSRGLQTPRLRSLWDLPRPVTTEH